MGSEMLPRVKDNNFIGVQKTSFLDFAEKKSREGFQGNFKTL